MGCCIGKPLRNSAKASLSDNANHTSANKPTANPAEALQRTSTYGRKTPESLTHSSSSDENLLDEIATLTGRVSALEQRTASLTRSMLTCSCDITPASNESASTTPNPFGDTTSAYKFFGGDPVWAKPVVPGMKRANAFTSRTLARNGGTDTRVNQTSSLTSSPGLSPSIIYSDGSIATHVSQK